jgi:alkanesulfonate monooxygenase SsuD/methylene tetrahydromethanopterin reductase-like flavin-dependent oxidoreductase (luciferase family)
MADATPAEDAAPAKIGFLLWPQTDSWPALRDAAVRADRAGAASLWTWDHLLSIVGPWQGPILEGWSILSGWAQVTERATLGLMVAANTFRNPGLTAKLATTLDQLSGGRAVLGIGGAWFEREHEAFGFDFGTGFGERLDRLDEAVMLLRRLLDGETVTHDGPVYPMRDALVAPRPVQPRLPIMIGGSGPKKTLRTLARYGDQWNGMGRLGKLRERDAILREHCAAIGRDHREIERTTTVDIVIRDTREAAMAAYRARMAITGETFDETWNFFLGTPEEIADGLRPLLELGFRHVFVESPAPYDVETIDRIGEVIERLNG